MEALPFAAAAIQVLKILMGMFSLARSLVSYQDELRRGLIDKPNHGISGLIASLLYRMFFVTSRVLAIASFGSIVVSHKKTNLRDLALINIKSHF